MAEVMNEDVEQPHPQQPSAPPQPVQSSQTKAVKKKKGNGSKSRSGSPNYTKDELDVLFSIVESVLPMEKNHWAVVGDRFKDWAIENDSVVREADSLRSKFDKLAGAKKPTGDAEPPPEIVKAKELAREINRKAAAVAIGDSESENNGEAGGEESANSNEGESEIVGSRRSARKPASTGTNKKARKDDVLERVVEAMGENIGEMTSVMKTFYMQSSAVSTDPSPQRQTAITRTDVESIIQESMKPTNDMLSNIMSFLTRQEGGTNGKKPEFHSPSGEERGSGGGAPSENPLEPNA